MKIIALNEGKYAVTKEKDFTLVTTTDRQENQFLTMAICPFLIVTKTDILLLDTGLGFKNNDVPLIVDLIEKNGYKASDVTKVLLSHLHKDHVDGIGRFEDGKFVSNFPEAAIYIQERELDYALSQQTGYSFNQEVLEELSSLPNLHLMNEDKGTIGDTISFEVTGGHSPFHQVFWIRENNEIVFYGADNLPQRSYLKFHIAYKSDFDGKKAMELRQHWEQLAKDEQWQVLFYHDIKNNIVQY